MLGVTSGLYNFSIAITDPGFVTQQAQNLTQGLWRLTASVDPDGTGRLSGVAVTPPVVAPASGGKGKAALLIGAGLLVGGLVGAVVARAVR